MDEAASPPHVLIIPVPAQGHINSMLRLAELFCTAGRFQVTFLTTASFHRRLLQHSDIATRFDGRLFRLLSIPDGNVADDHPHGGSLDLKQWFDSFQARGKPFLKDLLVNSDGNPVSCVISDGVLSFVLDVGEETGVPVLYFRTVSACAFWAYYCVPHLIQAQEIPFNSDDLDLPIVNVKGMEGILRRRDLPSFLRLALNSSEFQLIVYETLQTPRARGLILNTFDDLEQATLDQIRTQIPNVYTIGPIHAHLKTQKNASHVSQYSNTSSSLWEEDRSCLEWLDQQPPKSVIYISFGSITDVTQEALMELRHGLVNSGKRFLWVIRPDSVNGGTPAEVLEGMSERGRVVGWAPQEEVLAHAALGGFFTHCGWNSTLESIVAGVQMICWPYFADQQINSRFVDRVWKVGVDMKDRSDRVTVEKMVRDVMEGRRDELVEKATNLAKLAQESVGEGGTSRFNLDRLFGDIRDLGNAK